MKNKLKITFFSFLLTGLFFFIPQTVQADTCPTPNQNPCWVQKAPMPTARRELGIAADGVGKIYAVGGFDGVNGIAGYVSNLEVYDPAHDSWTEKTPMPVSRNDIGFAFSPTTRHFYAAGGYHEGNFSDFYEYDPQADTWIQKSSMPIARRGFGLAAANGKLYYIGGATNDGLCTDEVDEYDFSTDQWVSKSPMITPRCGFEVAVINDQIYTIGGQLDARGGYAESANVEIYTPATDTWLTKAPMPTARSYEGVSFTHQGTIYAIGGDVAPADQPVSQSNVVEEYDPVTNAWTSRSSLPVATMELSAALGNDGKVHALGGWTPTSGGVNTNFAGFVPDNQAPLVSSIAVSPNPVVINSPITASSTFTDADTSDTHTSSWNWGDGNITSGIVTETNGSGSVSGSHTYTATGVYTVTIKVTDTQGATGTQTYQYVAVYDPNAGFLTGSGKYTSQAGWDKQNTLVTGDVKIGIQAKYRNGNTPTGHNKITFNAGNLDFNATSYSWLVVSGAKATLQGNGTINGSGNYIILISGIDGNQSGGTDLIRMKITNPSNNNSVIYDTQSGAADTADPTTALNNGHIKIH